MGSRTVTGTVYHPASGSVWAGAIATFQLVQPLTVGVTTYPTDTAFVVAGTNGAFAATLATPDGGTATAAYRIGVPGIQAFTVNIASGSAIDVATLLNNPGVGTAQSVIQAAIDASLATFPAQAQTWTAQQTIMISAGSMFQKLVPTVDKATQVFYRYHNTAGPEWATATIVNSRGAWHTNAWMVISGNMPATPDAEGLYYPKTATNDSTMLSVWADVAGPAVEIRPSNDPTSYPLSCIGTNGTVRLFAIERTGDLHWGNGTTHAAMDTALYRSGSAILKTDGVMVAAGGVVTNGGATGARPNAPQSYQSYYDTSLGKPIWWDGSNWRDATGATV